MSARTCSVDGCDRPHLARGMCRMHYKRMLRTGSTAAAPPPPSTCSVDGCDHPRRSRGMCNAHYVRAWKTEKRAEPPSEQRPCSVDGCDRPVHARDWCSYHYHQWRRAQLAAAKMPAEATTRRSDPWWRDQAACRGEDPEMFFPIHTGRKGRLEAEAAKAVCARCPVRRECLTEALTTDAGGHGIWGGTTPDERRLLRHISPAKERASA